MKNKIIITILLLLLGTTLYAQYERESSWIVRINGNLSYLTDKAKQDLRTSLKTTENAKGYGVELGYKGFLTSKSGLFIEGSANIFWSKLPYNELFYATVDPSIPMPTASRVFWLCEDCKESGIGIKTVVGYDLRLFSKLSVEFFIGPEFRCVLNFDPNEQVEISKDLNRFYFRWHGGIGFNYWRFNLNATFSTDIHNRGKTKYRPMYYRLNYVTVALGYRFGL